MLNRTAGSVPGYRSLFKRPNVVVVVLAILYALSALDRNLPSVFLPHIQDDLRLSDTRVSMLAGAAFAIVYVTASMPLAHLADRWSRRKVIAIGLLIWGAMTALCGFAYSFPFFFLARMGVGFGEAAIAPASFALIAALFPSGKRARPTALMSLAFLLGTAGAMLAGGGAVVLFDWMKAVFPESFLAAMPSWRLTMVSAGLITLLMLLPTMQIADPPAEKTRDEITPSFGETLAEIWRERRGYAPVIFGFPFHAVGFVGFNTWITTIFVREFGWSVGEAGLKLGSVTVIGGLVGVVLGSQIMDRWTSRSESAPLTMAMSCIFGCAVVTWLIVLTHDANTKLTLVLFYQIIVFPINVLGLVAVQECARPKVRALFSSLVAMVASLAGVGLGPTVIALFTDYVFRDPQAVGRSVACAWLLVLIVSGSVMYFCRDAFADLVRRRRASTVHTPII